WLRADMRPGNVHTANGVVKHLLPVIAEAKKRLGRAVNVCGDAGMPDEDLLAALEEQDVHYAFRLKKNEARRRLAKPSLTRPAGRPPAERRMWVHELFYAAATWSPRAARKRRRPATNGTVS
ncbi:MAG: transposase, partial [Planctomycetes bacterium]|nr:transposase [Planctomycetota bacterium]